MKRRNDARRQKLFAKQFGSAEYVEYINTSVCCVPGCGIRVCEASHIRSRGAGGIWRDIVPKCFIHHHEWHSLGRHTWCRRYGLTLDLLRELAADYATGGEHLVPKDQGGTA